VDVSSQDNRVSHSELIEIAQEVNVAPHNFYGLLCTMMNAHFAAAVPNLAFLHSLLPT
jgi:hypothetical protein